MVTLALASNHATRDLITVADVTNLGDCLVGTAGFGQLIRLNTLSDATNYANIFGNIDTTNGRAVTIQYGTTASPTVLAQFNKTATILNVATSLKQIATPSDPGSTYTALYAKHDSLLYYFPTSGSETRLAKYTETPAGVLTVTGDMEYAASANTPTRLAIGTAFQELVVNSGATAPSWRSGALALAAAAGDIFQATGANALAKLSIGTARQTLLVNAGATALAYGESMQSLLTAAGDIIYASGANTPARLAKGTDGQFLKLASGLPSWATSPQSVQSSEALGSTGSPTSSSTSFADVTDMSVTITTTGGIVLVWFDATFSHTNGNASVALAIRRDASTDDASKSVTVTTANHIRHVSTFKRYSGLGAGTYTFKGRAKNDIGATLTFNGTERSLLVAEVPA